MSKIFLSYRRDDEPGYVGRIADALVETFGDVVFRDVDAIHGGKKWKLELERQVARARIVVAVIGKRWQTLLAQREPETDHVRSELNHAHRLEIPVIPVLIENAHLPDERDLGDLRWLRERQHFELSDRQGRWRTDLDQLAECIEQFPELERMRRREEHDPVEASRAEFEALKRLERSKSLTELANDSTELSLALYQLELNPSYFLYRVVGEKDLEELENDDLRDETILRRIEEEAAGFVGDFDRVDQALAQIEPRAYLQMGEAIVKLRKDLEERRRLLHQLTSLVDSRRPPGEIREVARAYERLIERIKPLREAIRSFVAKHGGELP